MAYKREVIRVDEIMIPDTRVPVALCTDNSGSMFGAPIEELNRGIEHFYQSIRDDRKAKNAAEICLVSFNNKITIEEEFANIRNQKETHRLTAGGMTYMGEAVNTCLDLLEDRKSWYKQQGISYHQPWLVLMTDGEPNGKPEELERAIRRARQLESERKLVVFNIGIGADADMKTLARFSNKRPPLKLQGLKFCEFFEWLSQSIGTTSRSMPGDKIPLGPVSGWASLDY